MKKEIMEFIMVGSAWLAVVLTIFDSCNKGIDCEVEFDGCVLAERHEDI